MSSTWIDFKELRSKLRFLDVLNFYKVEVKIKGDRASCVCPLPGHPVKEGKRRASFSCHLQKGVFQCFSCHAKGNLIDFGVFMDGGHPDDPGAFRRTAVKLAQQFGIQFERQKPERERRQRPKPAPIPISDPPSPNPVLPVIVNALLDFELKHLDPDHPYLIDRGFTPETIQRFGLGYCGKGLMRDRIAIPLHDSKGQLVGYAGRLVDDDKVSDDCPKYLMPGARERDGKRYEFHKSELLYNVHRIARPVNDLIVVEGFASVWWLAQHGCENVVAVMGSSASPVQRQLILDAISEDGRLWIMPDEDKAGELLADDLLHHLASRHWCRWVRYGGTQPTSLTACELTALLWKSE